MAELFTPLHDLFFYVSELENSIALRESQYVWAWLLVAHIIAMCLFAGTIIMMDLRLMGVGNMSTAFSQVQRRLFPWQVAGMVFSAITGAASTPDSIRMVLPELPQSSGAAVARKPRTPRPSMVIGGASPVNQNGMGAFQEERLATKMEPRSHSARPSAATK
mgnify:CR=1 FL=1